MEGLTTSNIARECGVNIETIRVTRSTGSCRSRPERNPGIECSPATRFGGSAHPRAQELGFTLKEIRELLNIRVKPGSKLRRCAPPDQQPVRGSARWRTAQSSKR